MHYSLRISLLAAVAAFLMAASARPAHAAVVTLGTSKDTSIFSNNTSNTAGGNDVLYVGKNASGATRRGLVEFDVAGSGIPTGSTIDSVTLTLYLNGFSGSVFGADRRVNVHRVTSDWANGTTGSGGSGGGGGQGTAAVAGNGDVTWSHRDFNSTAWTTAGGDYLKPASASLVISNSPNPVVLNSPYSWTGSVMTADVQAWLDHSLPNDGWLLRDLEDVNPSLLTFYTREIVDNPTTTSIDESQLRPRLTIEYTPVPEPSTLVIIATGMAMIVCLGWRRPRTN
jgi:hypothetical protein